MGGVHLLLVRPTWVVAKVAALRPWRRDCVFGPLGRDACICVSLQEGPELVGDEVSAAWA
mgnify:CR=1 FL=1